MFEDFCHFLVASLIEASSNLLAWSDFNLVTWVNNYNILNILTKKHMQL